MFRVHQATDGPVCVATDGDSPYQLLPGLLDRPLGIKPWLLFFNMASNQQEAVRPVIAPFPYQQLGLRLQRGECWELVGQLGSEGQGPQQEKVESG